MRLHSRRQLRVEGLETRMLLAADLAPISEANVPFGERVRAG